MRVYALVVGKCSLDGQMCQAGANAHFELSGEKKGGGGFVGDEAVGKAAGERGPDGGGLALAHGHGDDDTVFPWGDGGGGNAGIGGPVDQFAFSIVDPAADFPDGAG